MSETAKGVPQRRPRSGDQDCRVGWNEGLGSRSVEQSWGRAVALLMKLSLFV